MKQEKPGAYFPTRQANRPIRLVKHHPPSFDEPFRERSYGSTGHAEVDIAKLPTKRLPLFSDPDALRKNRAALTLSPEDYRQIDDQLDDNFDLSNINTVQLMHLTGVMRSMSTHMPVVDIQKAVTGAVPVVSAKPQPKWKALLNTPLARGVIGLAVGLAIIYLMSHLIDFKATAAVIASSLTTPVDILHICLAALAFVAAFTFRGIRWSFFLKRVEKVSVLKVVRIYWIGVFINFLLPVQGGELAKSVILKRVSNIPISQSLPTVAIDKALDLMPVLFIIAIVPFIPGIHMDLSLWLILAFVGSILVGLIVVVALSAWNRKAAVALINFFLRLLPKGIGGKIEGFAMGFVDSLLAGASNLRSFIPAILLTGLAVTCEGIFAWEAFQAVQLHMNFGIATFGYAVYTMFAILPTPPAGVGTNEGAKAIVFTGLLGFNSVKVNAMAILVHPVCTILIGAIGLISLQTLGVKLSSILQKQEGHQAVKK
ncbi:MAG TPA: lysylphosphatidylglycerol synthase transmembrane domain-containing protein [Ktedonobacteraceae bacterium]|jgi:hypothetical protein